MMTLQAHAKKMRLSQKYQLVVEPFETTSDYHSDDPLSRSNNGFIELSGIQIDTEF